MVWNHPCSYIVPLFVRFYLGMVIWYSRKGKLAFVECILCTKHSAVFSLSSTYLKCMSHLLSQDKFESSLHKLLSIIISILHMEKQAQRYRRIVQETGFKHLFTARTHQAHTVTPLCWTWPQLLYLCILASYGKRLLSCQFELELYNKPLCNIMLSQRKALVH